ncbi:aminotransferase class I and II [Capnocytophaga ochracea DSM 7271]|uniref:cysteine-S-conjugate beta-lyase n=1 Tax=Capnocytophaga ochracea (strain ATCC 27872 / DSM 7271 / CCUG 9716 / JCM 12966 / NCTC 12371 / SS31 / VPI 2845) TaxID=521097 RepID=C7M4M2_CAPOD|nr:PatB family C-S lyase [Capnocytophaga ochracea]ACU91652.1 aminotransferase class I and II [Capnocytophaga ochracea DSM 7271]UAK50430.1 PatB family C-S lyase [Capnocytophaga ochracea]
MNYNFDEVVCRKHTDALKLEALAPRWGRTDLLPMWVADMDFKTPPFIVEVMKKRMECEVFGYTAKPESWYEAIISWQKRRHKWTITKEMISFVPGVVPALAMAVQAFTQRGEKVMIQQPVYNPFAQVIRNNHRELVNCPLELKDGQYYINFKLFEKKIKGCKLFLFCHPHNPGGRVWTREELEKVATICAQNNVIIVADEIHADLTLLPYEHIPFASVSEEAKQNSVVFASPSKAFNMAGLATSYAVIANPTLRRRFESYVEGNELAAGNVFAFNTVVAAYNKGEEWLQQMLTYVQGNIDEVVSYIKENIPQLKVIIPQASYLVFIDFSALQLNQKDIVALCTNRAHLALNDGSIYGEEGNGYMRINLACPRSVVRQALAQLKDAITSI